MIQRLDWHMIIGLCLGMLMGLGIGTRVNWNVLAPRDCRIIFHAEDGKETVINARHVLMIETDPTDETKLTVRLQGHTFTSSGGDTDKFVRVSAKMATCP